MHTYDITRLGRCFVPAISHVVSMQPRAKFEFFEESVLWLARFVGWRGYVCRAADQPSIECRRVSSILHPQKHGSKFCYCLRSRLHRTAVIVGKVLFVIYGRTMRIFAQFNFSLNVANCDAILRFWVRLGKKVSHWVFLLLCVIFVTQTCCRFCIGGKNSMRENN